MRRDPPARIGGAVRDIQGFEERTPRGLARALRRLPRVSVATVNGLSEHVFAAAPFARVPAVGVAPEPRPLFSRLPFTSPWLLAPMDGVTDPAFRDVLLDLHSPLVLGGAFTEFVPVSQRPPPLRVLRHHLGARAGGAPVGLQLMGAEEDVLADSTRRAVDVGAPLVDLNFGCPAKGALKRCAGSAALDDPSRVERLVRACVSAAGGVPVTAKMRAGVTHADRVEEIARAIEAAGVDMLTVHCRTRAEAYRDPVDWTRIARAAAAVSIPVCGNGGVSRHADLERMRRETGCRLVMVGRGALADPWLFSGEEVDRRTAFRFLLGYAETMARHGETRSDRIASRVKQLIRVWSAGGAVDDSRESWLHEVDGARFLELLRREAERAGEVVARPSSPPSSLS
jgi:tRNA-dihydrouridine synthase C